MSGDEDAGAGGEPPDESDAADDAEVEAAIEQEPPAPPSDDDTIAGPDGEPVDAPEDPVDAPGADAGGDGPDADDDGAAEGDDEPMAGREEAAGQSGEADPTAGADGETIEVEVPSNLLRAWEHRAEKAKLSVSEYVVRMTEAGRMSVQMQPAGGGDAAAMSVEQLSDEVVEQLRHEEAVSWEQLVDAISQNLEEQLEEALERLQEDDVVRYSGLKGGYRLVEEDR